MALRYNYTEAKWLNDYYTAIPVLVDFDPEAINQLGQKGATIRRPNTSAIRDAVLAFRTRYGPLPVTYGGSWKWGEIEGLDEL